MCVYLPRKSGQHVALGSQSRAQLHVRLLFVLSDTVELASSKQRLTHESIENIASLLSSPSSFGSISFVSLSPSSLSASQSSSVSSDTSSIAISDKRVCPLDASMTICRDRRDCNLNRSDFFCVVCVHRAECHLFRTSRVI
jgi:hypothetical protein